LGGLFRPPFLLFRGENEISDDIARALKAMGRAVDAVAEPEPVDRSIGLTTDDLPKKRGRPKKVDIDDL
jgi:hypothetical protein